MSARFEPGRDPRRDLWLVGGFALAVLAMPLWMQPFGAAYPDLLQRFAFYGIFAVGFNILFGLTGYLSFGHAAFLGVGSYAAVWAFKLVTVNVLPAILFAMVVSGLFAFAIGYVSLRRSGIYFSILTLAFAQMCYNLAYSVLTPITNGETSLQLTRTDPRVLDTWLSGASQLIPATNLFGVQMKGYPGFYFCAVLLILAGVVTAVPLLLFGSAAIRVPMTTIGLLQYLTPVLQFLLGVFALDEHMTPWRWIGFALVWLALAIFTFEAIRHRRRQLELTAEAMV